MSITETPEHGLRKSRSALLDIESLILELRDLAGAADLAGSGANAFADGCAEAKALDHFALAASRLADQFEAKFRLAHDGLNEHREGGAS